MVDGIKGKALMDSCNYLSIVTQQYLGKLSVEYEFIDIICGRIWITLKNEEYSEDYVVQIPLKISNFEMLEKCKVVNKKYPSSKSLLI